MVESESVSAEHPNNDLLEITKRVEENIHGGDLSKMYAQQLFEKGCSLEAIAEFFDQFPDSSNSFDIEELMIKKFGLKAAPINNRRSTNSPNPYNTFFGD